jgi:hypothetical protein
MCSYLEIWLPHGCGADGAIALLIDPPWGERSMRISAAQDKHALQWHPNGKDVLCKAYYERFEATGRGRYLVALLPTAFNNPPTQLAPSGAWTIRLSNRSGKAITGLEAWIQWDDRPLGYPRTGRQSYFLDQFYQQFGAISGEELDYDNDRSVVKRAGSISGIATERETIVIGGMYRKELRAAKYSAGGPITPTSTGSLNRAGPDALAVSDDSCIHQGVLAAGTRSGSVVAMNGTSVAAPQIARLIADHLQERDRRHGRDIVKDIAECQERERQGSPLRPTEERGGWGRIETPPVVPRPRFADPEKGEAPQATPAPRPTCRRILQCIRRAIAP